MVERMGNTVVPQMQEQAVGGVGDRESTGDVLVLHVNKVVVSFRKKELLSALLASSGVPILDEVRHLPCAVFLSCVKCPCVYFVTTHSSEYMLCFTCETHLPW